MGSSGGVLSLQSNTLSRSREIILIQRLSVPVVSFDASRYEGVLVHLNVGWDFVNLQHVGLTCGPLLPDMFSKQRGIYNCLSRSKPSEVMGHWTPRLERSLGGATG